MGMKLDKLRKVFPRSKNVHNVRNVVTLPCSLASSPPAIKKVLPDLNIPESFKSGEEIIGSQISQVIRNNFEESLLGWYFRFPTPNPEELCILGRKIDLETAKKFLAEDRKKVRYQKLFSLSKDNIMTLTYREKKEFKQALNSFMKKYSEEYEKLGLSSLNDYLGAITIHVTNPIPISVEKSTSFFQGVMNPKRIKYQKGIKEIAANLSTYKGKGFSLDYSRMEFVSDLCKELSKMSEENQKNILKLLDISILTQNNKICGYDGFINLNKLNEVEQINPSIKVLVEKFMIDNPIKTDNPKVDKVLNKILLGLPELRNIIGKKHHGTHEYTIDGHTFKVLSEVLKHPKYENLSTSNKKVMMFTALLHDIGKKEGVVDKGHEEISAALANDILSKFDKELTVAEKDKIIRFIGHHNWVENMPRNAKELASIFRGPQEIEMAEIFAFSDLSGVSDDFLRTYRKKIPPSVKALQECIQNIKNNGQFISQTPVLKGVREIQHNGYTYRVLDLNDTETLKAMGLESKEQARFLVHVGDYSSVNNAASTSENFPIAASFITGNGKGTFNDKRYAGIVDVEQRALLNSYYTNQNSGKVRANPSVSEFLIDDKAGFERTVFLKELAKYGLNKKEYSYIIERLQNCGSIDAFPRFIKIRRGKSIISIPKKDLVKAYKKYETCLIEHVDENGKSGEVLPWSEFRVEKPRIKNIIARVDKIDEIDSKQLDFIKETGGVIVLTGKEPIS